MRLTALLLVAAVAIAASPVHGAPKVDPDTGKIRMLMIGETGPQNQQATYFLFSDPMVDLTIIPAGDVADVETSKRFVRVYIPRTVDKLVKGFDVIELFDFVPHVLLDQHIAWIHDAVKDHGLGLALVEMGWYAITDWTGNDASAWTGTILYEAYPCDLVIERQNQDTFYMSIETEDPLVSLPGFEKVMVTDVGHHGIQVARPGAKVYTVWKAGREDAIVGGTYGNGTTLMIPMGWDNVPDDTERSWDYYIDLVLNHAYFVADVPLPDDPDLARGVRLAFADYLTRHSLTSSLIDFVDKFGANTAKLEEALGQLEADRKEATSLYIEGDYEGAWEKLEEIFGRFQSLSEESIRLRERAFFWIYLIEWFVVTGTLLVCGFTLWSLMVKRRLYREVEVTRRAL